MFATISDEQHGWASGFLCIPARCKESQKIPPSASAVGDTGINFGEATAEPASGVVDDVEDLLDAGLKAEKVRAQAEGCHQAPQ